MKDKYDDAGILIRPIVKLESGMDIVEKMRSLESDHDPDGWPAVTMGQVSALCDEIDRLRAQLKFVQEQEPVIRVRDGLVVDFNPNYDGDVSNSASSSYTGRLEAGSY